MKILWFSPVPLPAVCRKLDLTPFYGGWWIWSMLRVLAGRHNLELAVACPNRDCSARFSFVDDGITYYVFPDPGLFPQARGILRKISDQIECLVGRICNPRSLAEAVAVVNDFHPDLVHVFGSEHYIGLIASLIDPPLVIWIQGILNVYRNSHFGGMGCLERLRYPRIMWDYYRTSVKSEREREIFRRCRYFMGRTGWDEAHQFRLQPKGHYYRVQECLRPEFSKVMPWQLEEAAGQTVYTTTSSTLLKGTEVLIKAISLLRPAYPEIRLKIAGSMNRKDPVVRRMFKLVQELDLADQVMFLGQLDSSRIVNELKHARVFVLPSYIENSSNSLAEAQLVGTPVVASFVGGVPDMVVDGETGILYQAGDQCMLARQIERVFLDDALSMHLSRQARQGALKRHAPEDIVNDMLRSYEEILNSCN
jgi:glycosyltransferase involved in cell wall biosynthesis